MPRVRGDGAGSTWDVEHELRNTFSARVGNVFGPTESYACERV